MSLVSLKIQSFKKIQFYKTLKNHLYVTSCQSIYKSHYREKIEEKKHYKGNFVKCMPRGDMTYF